MKRLYRSTTDAKICGICGGLGEYFSLDPVLFRAVAILMIIGTTIVPGIIVYFLLALIIPKEPSHRHYHDDIYHDNNRN
ncbi:MAG: PspC domain-containing protein [Defluviitaleaceae bacterium]|nr:PspC domain-containing protein [Defluviitaleaceae bacterium]